MEQHYGNPIHMATLSMQSHQQQSNQQHYPHQGQQYQQLYQDYADSCYQTPAYHDAGFPAEQYAYHPTASVPYGTGIESYLDPKYATNPAAFASRLPYLPFHAAAVAAYGMYDYSFEPAFIRKRNERERQRVKCVNEGYARLREHLPDEYAEKRLSKVETLRGAIMYIKKLQTLLGFDPEKRTNSKKKEETTPKSEKNKETNTEKEQNEENSIKQSDSSESHTQKSTCLDKERENKFHACGYSQQNNTKAAKSDIKVENIIPPPPENDITETFECDELYHQRDQQRFKSCMKQSNLNRTESSPQRANVIDMTLNSQFFSNGSKTASRLDCQVEEEKQHISQTGQRSRSGRLSSLENSELDISHWTQQCSKGQSIFNIAEELSHKAYARNFSDNNDSETFNVMIRNSRHHPYSKYNSMSNSSLRWDRTTQVKTESLLPYNYYNSCEQQDGYINQRHRYVCSKIAEHNFSKNTLSTDGQSDGFKSDTSPESSAGQSP